MRLVYLSTWKVDFYGPMDPMQNKYNDILN